VIQEGIAVDPLLARAGWNLAILSVSGHTPYLKNHLFKIIQAANGSLNVMYLRVLRLVAVTYHQK
jgi:hypothetical protein